MTDKIFIVTGAPGAGKSAAINELLKATNDFLIYDIDWLARAASELSGKDVIFDKSTWKDYRKLWLEVLDMAGRNKRNAILFASIDKKDVEELGQDIAQRIEWCLLDCSDDVRLERLNDRPNWTDAMTKEAAADAKKLRQEVGLVIRTDNIPVSEVAKGIRDWFR